MTAITAQHTSITFSPGNTAHSLTAMEDWRYLALHAKNMSFELGDSKKFYGHPEAFPENLLDGSRFRRQIADSQGNVYELRRHFVYGEGSCWARALTQVVLSHLFKNESNFDATLKKVYEIVQDLNRDNPDAEELTRYTQQAVHIFYQLRHKTPAERIEYLNHKNVDTALIFFIRHLAGEYMRKNCQVYSAGEIQRIKTDIRCYGGPEAIMFCRCLGLELTQIVHYRGEWKLAHLPAGAIRQQYIDLSKAQISGPCHIMFGINEGHFEFISLEPCNPAMIELHPAAPTALPLPASHVVATSLDQLVHDMLEYFSSLPECQVTLDPTALELQRKFLEEYLDNQEQEFKDRSLAQELYAREVEIARRRQMDLQEHSPEELPARMDISGASPEAKTRFQEMNRRLLESASIKKNESWLVRLKDSVSLLVSNFINSIWQVWKAFLNLFSKKA